MVYTFRSSKDTHDAAHTMMISDIATSAWLTDFCHKDIYTLRLEKSFKKFYGRYQDVIEKYQGVGQGNGERFIPTIIYIKHEAGI